MRIVAGRGSVGRLARTAAVPDVAAETALREGAPATEILDYAEERDADLTVAGTHGRIGVGRRVIGSVAERLVRHATCPVMTVRLPETDPTVTDAERARELIDAALAEGGPRRGDPGRDAPGAGLGRRDRRRRRFDARLPRPGHPAHQRDRGDLSGAPRSGERPIRAVRPLRPARRSSRRPARSRYTSR